MGCGEVALQFHGPVLRHLRRRGLVRVAGCYDPSVERARRLSRLLRAERWGTEAPAVPSRSVDGVLVATSPEVQPHVTLPYLGAGRHALLEKPFGATRARADLLVSTARAHGARLLAGHLRRFYPSVQIARAFVQAGGLGAVRRVVACEGARWGTWPTRSNYAVEDRFGGVLYDTGSHVLDTVLFVLGLDERPGTSVRIRHVERDQPEPSQDFRAELTLHGAEPSELPVHLTLSRTRAIPGGVRLEGDGGTLLIPPAFSPAPRLILDRRVFTLDRPDSEWRALDVLGSVALEHLALVDAVHHPERRSPLEADRFLFLADVFDALVQASQSS